MKDLTKTETINITPTWLSLHPLFCEWIDNGAQSQKDFVKEELKRLCKVVDALKNKEAL